jgi:hypothetical protein
MCIIANGLFSSHKETVRGGYQLVSLTIATTLTLWDSYGSIYPLDDKMSWWVPYPFMYLFIYFCFTNELKIPILMGWETWLDEWKNYLYTKIIHKRNVGPHHYNLFVFLKKYIFFKRFYLIFLYIKLIFLYFHISFIW